MKLALPLWLFLQLATLAFCALRHDRDALTIMLAVQFASSALLASILMDDFWAGCVIVIASIPFVQLAGAISASPIKSMLHAAISLLLWLISLLSFAQAFRSRVSRAILNVFASCIVIGGALLVYVRDEFGSGWDSSKLFYNATITLSTTVVIGVILAATTRYAHTRQLIHAL